MHPRSTFILYIKFFVWTSLSFSISSRFMLSHSLVWVYSHYKGLGWKEDASSPAPIVTLVLCQSIEYMMWSATVHMSGQLCFFLSETKRMQLEAVMQVCTDSCIFIIEKCHSARCLRLTSNKLAEVYALIHIPDKEDVTVWVADHGGCWRKGAKRWT